MGENTDVDPLAVQRPSSPSPDNATVLATSTPPLRRFGWAMTAIAVTAAASLVLQLVPLFAAGATAPSRAQLAVCAQLSRDAYEDLAAALGTRTLGWVESEEDRRRALRALERADEALLDVLECYEDLPGAQPGETSIQEARIVLAEWSLLYQEAGIREPKPDWHDLAITVKLL